MPSPSKPQIAVYAAFAVAILLIGARFLSSGGDGASAGSGDLSAAFTAVGASSATANRHGHDAAASGDAAAGAAGGAGSDASAPGTPDGVLVVDVEGAVRRPGVYRLPTGARTIDAVRRAGGLTHGADRVGVNLAARVADGGEVVVPGRGIAAQAAGRGALGGPAAAADTARGGKSDGPLSLDLDTATEQQLEQLDGVGPATAAKIVAYRTQRGGITSVDQLEDVPGIGPAKLAAIRAQLGQ